MSDPGDLAAFLGEAWQHLSRGVADAKAPARTPTFATVSPEGRPEARTVVLRRAAQSAGEVEVHTDTQTAKVRALRACPFAALHVWVPRAKLQIRLSTAVTLLSGEDVEAEWNKVPQGSRISYGTEPAPGTPIAGVHAYEKPPQRARFMVLRCQIEDMDLVHLGEPHRRARYLRADGFAGTWVAP